MLVLVMFWEWQYFACSVASFSVNAHGLRHVTDKPASFIHLLVLADNTSTASQLLGLFTLTCPQHGGYVRWP